MNVKWVWARGFETSAVAAGSAARLPTEPHTVLYNPDCAGHRQGSIQVNTGENLNMDRFQSNGASRYRLSGTLDRLRKLDMVQHCKCIAYGTDGSGGKGCTRMRPKLHLPVFGHAFRLGVIGGVA